MSHLFLIRWNTFVLLVHRIGLWNAQSALFFFFWRQRNAAKKIEVFSQSVLCRAHPRQTTEKRNKLFSAMLFSLQTKIVCEIEVCNLYCASFNRQSFPIMRIEQRQAILICLQVHRNLDYYNLFFTYIRPACVCVLVCVQKQVSVSVVFAPQLNTNMQALRKWWWPATFPICSIRFMSRSHWSRQKLRYSSEENSLSFMICFECVLGTPIRALAHTNTGMACLYSHMDNRISFHVVSHCFIILLICFASSSRNYLCFM